MNRLSVAQTPRAGEDYPFLGDSHGWNAVVFDMCVEYDPALHTLPLRLVGYGEPAIVSGRLAVVVVDDNDNVVFDTAEDDPRVARSWAGKYTVNTWTRADRLLTVIVNDAYEVDPSQTYEDAVLDPRVCLPQLARVTSLKLVDQHNSLAVSAGHAESMLGIAGGYNVSPTVRQTAIRVSSGQRLATTVQFAAIPGAGQGKFNSCDDELAAPVLRKINNVGTEDGKFTLTGDPCIQVLPRPAQNVNAVAIQDNCQACCDCDDFLPVARGLLRVADRLAFLEQVVQTQQTTLAEQVGAAKDLLACHRRDLQLRVSQYGNCGLSIVAGYLNTTMNPQDEVVLELRFYVPEDPNSDSIVWVPGRVSNFADSTMVYRDAKHVAMTRPAILDRHRIRFSVGCVGTGYVASAVVTPWLSQGGPHLVCLTQIPAPSKSEYTLDDISTNNTAHCVQFSVNCDPSTEEIAAKLLRIGTQT